MLKPHEPQNCSCISSPFDFSSPIRVQISESQRIDLLNEEVVSLKDEVRDYERMIIHFQIDGTAQVEDLRLLQHPNERDTYFDKKIQEHRNEGIQMRDVFARTIRERGIQTMRLSDEIKNQAGKIAEVEAELKPLLHDRQIAIEHMKMASEAFENQEREWRRKERRIAEIEFGLEEDKRNFEQALDEDQIMKALATRLGLLKSQQRRLDNLYEELESFLGPEREINRKEIERLQRENAQLRVQSSKQTQPEGTHQLVENERMAFLEERIRQLGDEVVTSTALRLTRARDDAERIQDLEESSKILQRFPGGRGEMDKRIKDLERNLDEAGKGIESLERNLEDAEKENANLRVESESKDWMLAEKESSIAEGISHTLNLENEILRRTGMLDEAVRHRNEAKRETRRLRNELQRKDSELQRKDAALVEIEAICQDALRDFRRAKEYLDNTQQRTVIRMEQACYNSRP